MRLTLSWLQIAGLALLAAGCGGPSPGGVSAPDAGSNVTTFLGGADDGGRFARAGVPWDFSFPEDQGAHPEFRTEWWYLTGNLQTETGRHFGFQITFFRYALQADVAQRSSAWVTDQLWMAHFAVTDTANGAFFADQKFQRQALDLAGVQVAPFRVWLDHWQLASAGQGFFPLRLDASNDDVALELTLSAGKPLVLQGDAGLDPKGPEAGNASYYYSYTRLPVEGTLSVSGDSFAVAGSAWMDREWSTSMLGPELEGWDWFALQLDDGSDIMFYQLRHRDQTSSPYSSGIIIGKHGRVVDRLNSDQVLLDPMAYWVSPETGVRYTVGWQLEIPDHQLKLDIRPRLPNQELDLAVRYWEGAIVVEGLRSAAPISGVGYGEYAGVSRRGI